MHHASRITHHASRITRHASRVTRHASPATYMRLVSLAIVLPLLSARAQTREMSVSGARDLVYAHDGRLALSVRGDLWIVSATGRWSRVTADASWDREPSWSTDGKSLLFASN